MEVDASDVGVGAILSQRSAKDGKVHPCAFFSHRLTPSEHNYDVGNRELLAVKLALEEWRHWLEGSSVPFLVWTDHKNLEYIRTAKRLNSRQARWCLLFSRFNFTLSFRPGSKNGKPDALSRIFPASSCPEEPRNILPGHRIVGAVQWDIESLVRSAQPDNAAPVSALSTACLSLCPSVPRSCSGVILPGSPAILELGAPKPSSAGDFGGLPLEVMFVPLSQPVLSVHGVRTPRNPLPACCSPYPSPRDRGLTLLWISLLASHRLMVTPLFSQLLIDFPNQYILFHYPRSPLQEDCKLSHAACVQVPWIACGCSFRQRPTVHVSLLESLLHSHWCFCQFVLRVPSSKQWPDGAGKPTT